MQALGRREVRIAAGHGEPGAHHYFGSVHLRMSKSKHMSEFVHGQALKKSATRSSYPSSKPHRGSPVRTGSAPGEIIRLVEIPIKKLDGQPALLERVRRVRTRFDEANRDGAAGNFRYRLVQSHHHAIDRRLRDNDTRTSWRGVRIGRINQVRANIDVHRFRTPAIDASAW